MDRSAEFDAYCERLGPEYWAEPVNAVTNLAFILSALLMWRRAAGVTEGRVLCVILFAIGSGSYLWHTHATAWAGASDVLPIVVFILTYIFLINRDVWGMRAWVAGAATALFIPYAALTVPLFARVPGLGDSAGYAPVPLLILIYAWALWRRFAALSRGLAIGATILIFSISFRALDVPICQSFPLGTHFLWHILNAIMLGWMIEVYCRHRRAVAA